MSKKGKVIFCDIDGTLTDHEKAGGKPLRGRIERLNRMVEEGHYVVLWSAGGLKYVKKFAEENGVKPSVCIPKPHLLIDDNPTIRPLGRIQVKTPLEVLGP